MTFNLLWCAQKAVLGGSSRETGPRETPKGMELRRRKGMPMLTRGGGQAEVTRELNVSRGPDGRARSQWLCKLAAR
jgi:hypothetical protein